MIKNFYLNKKIFLSIVKKNYIKIKFFLQIINKIFTQQTIIKFQIILKFTIYLI